MGSNSPLVFVSHSSGDVAIARKLSSELQRRGIRTFLDTEIPPGQNWKETVEQELERASVVLVIVAGRFGETTRREREESILLWERAFEASPKLVVPILRADAEAPAFLRRFKSLKLPEGSTEWREFADRLAVSIARPGDRPVPTMDAASRALWKDRMVEIEREAEKLPDGPPRS